MVNAAVAGSLINMLGRVVEGVWRARRPVEPRPVGALADLLAKAVYEEWRREAAERLLSVPEPIPVSWSLSELPVSGPVETAVGSADVAPDHPPLPGQHRITQEQLEAGGGRRELFAVYAGIASGRVVVVGAPGAGKTGSAVLLVLDALEHREGVEDAKRARVPVPVLLTSYGWDPATCPVQDWLVGRLVASYPQLFQHHGGQAEAAALVAAGAVALVLDGLDEMDVTRRSAALRALSYAPFRVVVLSRIKEMVEAAAYLVGAVAIELHDVAGSQAADYLHRARTGPPPSGWTQLLSHLRDSHDSALARGLCTPLVLTLIRDTYRPGQDVSDLLTTHWSTADAYLTEHLITRVLPDAYTPRPGRAAPRYSEQQARQVLTFLARQMNQDHTRDLAWWQIPRWAPTTPRLLTSILAGGFLGGFLGGLAFVLVYVVAFLLRGQDLGKMLGGELFLFGPAFGVGIGLLLGFWFGRGGGEPNRVKNWRAIRVRSVLAAGLAYGPVYVLAVLLTGLVALGLVLGLAGALSVDINAIPGAIRWPVLGLVLGFAVGLTLGLNRELLVGRGEGEDSTQMRIKIQRNARVAGIVVGTVVAIGTGIGFMVLLGIINESPSRSLGERIVVGIVVGILYGLVVWLLAWLVAWLMVWLGGRFVGGLRAGFATKGECSPQGPRESWHDDRMFGLVAGLAFGLAPGLIVGLVVLVFNVGFGLWVGLALGLASWLGFGLAVGLMYGIMSSATWSTTLAWRQLGRSHRVPAVGLVPFLEDARDRGVLRTIGAVYQFRHATLQDQLAEQTTASPAISLASQTEMPAGAGTDAGSARCTA